jgi:DNA-directed RNA polymerase specialized sigma24 family protein
MKTWQRDLLDRLLELAGTDGVVRAPGEQHELEMLIRDQCRDAWRVGYRLNDAGALEPLELRSVEPERLGGVAVLPASDEDLEALTRSRNGRNAPSVPTDEGTWSDPRPRTQDGGPLRQWTPWPGPQDEETIDEMEMLERVVHALTDREADVLRMLLDEKLSTRDAGHALGVSHVRVISLRDRAIEKMRRVAEAG